MTRRIATLALATACSAIVTPRSAFAQRALTQDDSVAIVRAAWDAFTKGARVGPCAPALWLWTPVHDTARFVALSPAARVALVMDGVPASTRRPLGDDTLVVRITGWRPDSAGATLELSSLRMLVLGSGAHRCRTGGGAVQHFRVRPRGTEWIATPVGPALIGDLGCTPIR